MVRLFASHPTAAALLGLVCIVLGLVALPGLQRDTFPDFRADRLEVRIVYPGAAAEETEESLCLAIEDALDGLTGIATTTCSARANLAVAELELDYGAEVGRALTEVKAEIDAIDTLPEAAERPIVRQLGVTEPVVALALAGPMSAPDLRNLAERLKGELLELAGVAEVVVGGFAERQLEVALDDARLRALGLSAAAVAAIIERQSLDLPAGTLETDERDIRVRFADRRRTAADLERIVIRDSLAGTIRLGDIARVTERFTEEEVATRFDGERAAIITVRRNTATDALRVMAEVEAFRDRAATRLPPSVTLALTNDNTSLIADRLRMLVINSLEGFGLVCLVLWAFFSWRFSLTVAAALPLSLLASVFVIDAIGLNINMLSTVGFLIAIGLLIDSAIVINENIASHAAREGPGEAAATSGVAEVAPAVLASFFTSIAIFLPAAFLEGDIGRVLLVVPIVLIVVLAASLVVSFLVLPFFAARVLEKGPAHPLRRRLDQGFEAFRERVIGRLVRLAVAWRYLVLGLTGLLFFGSVSLIAGGTLKFQAFPDIEGDIVEARLMLVPGSPLHRTEAVVDRLVGALERVDARLSPGNAEGLPLVRNITVEMARNADVADQGPYLATVKADLLTSERRAARVDAILEAWREEAGPITDLVSLVFKEPGLGPAGHPIEIRLTGDDLETLMGAGRYLGTVLERYAGVEDVTSDLHPGMPELRLELAEGAGRLGLDAAAIASQLRAAFQGVTADEVPLGRETVRIDVRHGLDWRASLGRLDDFMLTLDDGNRVPLMAVVEVEPGQGFALIPRRDGKRVMTVTGDVDTRFGNANEILQAVQTGVPPVLEERYPGVTLSLGGQAESQAETGGSMGRVFVIGLVAMFVILSFQFRSLVEPLIVMAAIPLALTGVIWGHVLMGLDLSMPSMVGFVSLAGIVVNNSILLVAFTKEHSQAGKPIAEAASQASLDRFRAIFMTTTTTVAGLLPLLFETSVQAQVLVPLVTSLAFGLMAATVLVLFLVPAAYVILEDLRRSEPAAKNAAEPA